MNKEDKNKLRRHYSSLRDALCEEERQKYSKIICEKLLPYLEEKKILSYAPIRSEVDVSRINEIFDVAYPHIREDKKMDALLPKNDRFLINKYQIREPDPSCSTLIRQNELQVIIVPLLAFDQDRQRLGYGGGYYDRYLKNTDALKIGVAYELQKTDLDLKQEHDVPLDLIITEKSIYGDTLISY